MHCMVGGKSSVKMRNPSVNAKKKTGAHAGRKIWRVKIVAFLVSALIGAFSVVFAVFVLQ